MLKARVDKNQKAIVECFRACGYSVAHTHTIGKGFPDIVVGKNGINTLVEIKDGSTFASQRKLTPDEVEFHKKWRGTVVIISSIEDVLNFNHNSINK